MFTVLPTQACLSIHNLKTKQNNRKTLIHRHSLTLPKYENYILK